MVERKDIERTDDAVTATDGSTAHEDGIGTIPDSVVDALCRGEHGDPFSVLGPHRFGDQWCIRALGIGATQVELLLSDGTALPMHRVRGSALFMVSGLQGRPEAYRLLFRSRDRQWCAEDAYRFSSPLGQLDLHLIAEGTHLHLYERFGAHIRSHENVAGVHFCVWAPNARRVSVVGPFNRWDGRVHVMRFHPGAGVWDLFVPRIGAGELYKFEILGANGQLLPLKADPFAKRMEPPPGNACIVDSDDFQWNDTDWMAERPVQSRHDQPICVYELHAASWRRHIPDGRPYSYDELADSLIPYVQELGFTHIELLPITEHPFDGSWGYQPIGLFAPTWRHGSPQACKRFIDRCHQAGIGVIVDWVPAHFPRDTHGLGLFDGTHLYEHADPRKGAHQDWGTLIFNYGRREVRNYLIASALHWIRNYHIDALRVDAVASMLYLDYSRDAGEWLPNEHGGNENLDAVKFLQRLNEVVHAENAVSIAEESTAWPQVSRPVHQGGLGFSYKWNMGWMHDTLIYMGMDPIHRRFHQDKLTFGLLYAFSENFMLPLSHDEVVHGKRSLLDRMPGDAWQKFANLRLLYALMFAYPGKKLLFMGDEFAQGREWNHCRELDWYLLENDLHKGVWQLVRDLNRLYRSLPALHRLDHEPAGFEWIDCDDRDNSVLAFVRHAPGESDVLVVCNFTPVVRHGYRLGAPNAGRYVECLNSDAQGYSGRGIGNLGVVLTEPVSSHGRPNSVELSLPPLGALWLRHEPGGDLEP